MKTRDTSSALGPALLEAVDLALGGDWQAAHLMQDRVAEVLLAVT